MNSSKIAALTDEFSYDNMPQHVAIIMDGNGRWAKRRMIGRLKGHEKGAYAVKEVVECCSKLGISIITLYVFSTENWKRPESEISGLMEILMKFLTTETEFLFCNNVSLGAIGQLHRLPLYVRETLESLIESTSVNNGTRLNLALSYGGRAEITDVVFRIASEVKAGRMLPESITSKIISKHLNTCGMPDPDVLIRTGGEMRISNFLLWQIAYTEIFFTNTLWPDFGAEEFTNIIKEFPKRNRRFGSVIL